METEIGNDLFRTTGKTLKALGWKIVYQSTQNKGTEEDGDEENQSLPPSFTLDEQLTVLCAAAKTVEKKTTPPKWFTEASLIAAMKNPVRSVNDKDLRDTLRNTGGLATEATRASIIEKLKKIGYITIKGKRITVTEKGKQAIELIIGAGIQALTSVELTAKWEQYLDRIAKGQGSYQHFMDNIEKFAHHIVQQVKQQQPSAALSSGATNGITKCPANNCKGYIIPTKFGYGCSDWKNGCKFTIGKEFGGKKITEAQVKALVEKGKTNYLKFKKGDKEYEARLVLEDKNTGKFKPEFKNRIKN